MATTGGEGRRGTSSHREWIESKSRRNWNNNLLTEEEGKDVVGEQHQLLELKEHPKRGRSFVARRNIAPGEVLLKVKPLAFVIGK